jgi:hypothetical protein
MVVKRVELTVALKVELMVVLLDGSKAELMVV